MSLRQSWEMARLRNENEALAALVWALLWLLRDRGTL